MCSPTVLRRFSSLVLLLSCALFTLLVRCPPARASEVSLDLTQYSHASWTAREGLKGSTRSIVQTPDGYLWLGTEFGLVRFDGVRFVPSGAEAGPPPNSNNSMSLLAARDGTLWVGAIEGLASWYRGKLVQYPQLGGGGVFALLEDDQGTIWAGGTAGLCAIRSGRVECSAVEGNRSQGVYYLYGNRGNSVFSLYEDSERHLWAGTESGLWQWTPGPPHRYQSWPIVAEQALVQGDRAKGLSVITGDDRVVRQIDSNGREQYTIPGVGQPFRGQRLLRDRHGALWIGTLEHGLLHVHDGRVTRFGQVNGLSGNLITALFEDREGNIWVGTTNGLDRFREPAVSTITANQGLSTPAYSVLSARDGSIWIGSYGGLNRWSQGQMTVYRASAPQGRRSAAAQELQTGLKDRAAGEIMDVGLPDNEIGSLFEDARGRIWVSTRDGAGWFENGRFTRVKGAPVGSANAIVADTGEGVWISSLVSGLFHVLDGRVIESVPWPWSRGGSDPRVSSVVPDPSTSGLWLGFLNGGIAYFQDRQVNRSFSRKEGLGSDTVWNLHFDHEGTLWAATEGGLSRLKDGRVATLTVQNGLPCDAIHWVIEDDEFALWLYTACGLLRIDRAELKTWVLDSKRAIHPTMFDGTDGIRIHTLINGFSPVVTKSADGKLWFTHADGVSVIDPLHLQLNRLPPPVHIEQITADGKSYPPTPGLRLPPRVRDLSINYTALSLVAPEKVRFRFKLAGQDTDWREVINNRNVQYSNLAPGNYHYRVIAANNSGVWNEEGATLDFSIAAAYWQTNWFRALCLAVLIALLCTLYRLRLLQLTRKFERDLDTRVAERTRIARELHDTLLQSFHGLLLRFQTVWRLLPSRPAEAREMLGGAIDQAARAITEGRQTVQGLRTSAQESNDLVNAIRTLGEEIATSETVTHAAAFRVNVEGTTRPMHPIVRDEIYRIAAEALRNAFRHSRSTQIEVEVRYDERHFRLRVRDDGKGIDAQVLADQGREGHFGLRGMRERAELIGGKLTLWSALEAGTELELSVPASHAYAPTRA